MAAAAASGVVGGITFTAVQKGEMGNLINVIIQKPDGATGAVVVSESGNTVTVKVAADGATGVISSTISGVKAAVNAGARLVTAAGGTDGNTGAVGTGALAAGAAATTTGYDDLAAATGDGWTLRNVAAPGDGKGQHGGVDVLEKVDSNTGLRIRVYGDAATGATNVLRPAYNAELRYAKRGLPRTLKALGASGNWNSEYLV